MSTGLVSHNLDSERMLKYRAFAAAFAYPDDDLFLYFQGLELDKNVLISDYDSLFRASEIWLYGAEYTANNEFQRVNDLSDIMAFYRAFGVEPEGERPDALSSELEFMHYLIFKRQHALKGNDQLQADEKASVCFEAEQKFFLKHLCPAAVGIGKAIISNSQNSFYSDIAKEMLDFIESEEKLLGGKAE